MKCPTCSAENIEGALFCEECGAKLEQQGEGAGVPVMSPGVPTEDGSEKAQAKRMLILKDSGKEIDLPEKEEVTIGREDPISEVFPDIDLTPYGGDDSGVSRLHCRLVKTGDTMSIEDMKSTNSTFVNKKRLAPQTPQPIADGDEIRLGKLVLIYKAAA